ncbi:MAG TPA: hypothetical protein VGM05_00310 [Planctomycetaceae bacterium]|jgi:hypothetical protein
MSEACATLELPAPPSAANECATAASSEAGCPKCGNLESWGCSSWCPECGYYPRLETSVGDAAALEAPAAKTSVAPRSPLDVWQHAPAWIKVLCLGILAIFGGSLAGRLLTPDNSVARSLWGTCQLIIGFGVFAVFHLLATLKATFKNNRTGFIDCIIHPFDVWRPTIHELPGTARRVWLAVWGLTAAVCAVVLVGGIRYSVLVEDWGFRERAKADIAAQIRAKAMEEAMAGARKAESLEDAVKNAAANGKNKEQESELEMQANDCVVVGYNINPADGTVTELLLASVVDNQLKYVGTVQQGIPDEVRAELASRLPDLKRQTPFVKCSGSAVWVRPIVACRTKFKAWTDDKVMTGVTFKELLADVKGG